MTVEELASLLSETQRHELEAKINSKAECFSQVEMISKFIIAKIFVCNACRIMLFDSNYELCYYQKTR